MIDPRLTVLAVAVVQMQAISTFMRGCACASVAKIICSRRANEVSSQSKFNSVKVRGAPAFCMLMITCANQSPLGDSFL